MAVTATTKQELLQSIDTNIRNKTLPNSITTDIHADLLTEVANVLYFTGNTSGNCIGDLYLSNMYGCSPITFHDKLRFESGSGIQKIDGTDIILDTGEIFTSEITVTSLDGKTSKEVFKTPLIQGKILDATVTTPTDGTGILVSKAYRVNDFVLTLGSGTTGDTGFETGQTQVVFEDTPTVGGVVMKIADANGLQKSFKLEMLDKVELFESDSSKVTKLDSITSNSSDVIETLYVSGGTGDTITTTKSTGGGDQGCANKCAGNSLDFASCYKDCVAAKKKQTKGTINGVSFGTDVTEVYGTNSKDKYDTLYVSGGTGDTITTTKSTGTGSDCVTKCEESCRLRLGLSTGVLTCITGCSPCKAAGLGWGTKGLVDGVLAFDTSSFKVYGANENTESVTLKISGDTGTTVTETKSMGAGFDCSHCGHGTDDDTRACIAECRGTTSVRNTASKSSSITSVLGGVLEVYASKLDSVSANEVYDSVTLYVSGETGNTITETKSTGGGSICISECEAACEGSLLGCDCEHKCSRAGKGWGRKSTINGETVHSSGAEILDFDSLTVYDTLYISGDTGTTVTTIKSTGVGCKQNCVMTNTFGSTAYYNCIAACPSEYVTSKLDTTSGFIGGVVNSKIKKVKVLLEDSYDVIETLYVSGETGNTITETKSTGGGDQGCANKCAGNSLDFASCYKDCVAAKKKQTKGTINGVSFGTDVTEVYGTNSKDKYDTLYVSGDTGTTVTTIKSTGVGCKQNCVMTNTFGSSAYYNCIAACPSEYVTSKLNTTSGSIGGVVNSKIKKVKVLLEDSYDVIKTLYVSGTTGDTLTVTKNLSSKSVDSMIPIGRGQREYIDGGSGDSWEIVNGFGANEVYGITYSSTTGTVETIKSTVLQTGLHNESVKITNDLVTVPNIKIGNIVGGISVSNLGITSDGTVITGSTSGHCNTCKYVESFTFTGDSISTITHSLGDADVQVQIKDSTGNLIIPNSVNNYTTNTVDIGVSITGTYRVIIIG